MFHEDLTITRAYELFGWAAKDSLLHTLGLLREKADPKYHLVESHRKSQKGRGSRFAVQTREFIVTVLPCSREIRFGREFSGTL